MKEWRRGKDKDRDDQIIVNDDNVMVNTEHVDDAATYGSSVGG